MMELRRLAAILSADGQGESRLLGEAAVARFGGRIVDSLDDTLLAEFPSVVNAIECAVAIQREVARRNTGRPADRGQEPRIGVSFADVRVEGTRVHGDAIDVVARVRTLARPGGVVISGPAHDQVTTKLPYRYEALGAYTIESLTQPVLAYRIAETDLVAPAPRQDTAHAARAVSATHKPSIAVLPFREYDIPENRHYFAEGMVEDIVGALACLPDLFVISRSSTLGFRGENADVRAVGATLGVQYVLSGSVRRAAEKIRTLAQLCETETGGILWTDSLEGSVSDIFALQDRLSERIVTTIAPHVRQAELRRALRKHPENLRAYDFVLRGLDLLYRLRRDEFEQAREMFERAIALEPAYAAPYALTANWYSIRIGQGWSVNLAEDYDAVNRLASAALERDPFDARALVLCGHVRAFLFRDYDSALVLFQRALTASPSSAEAWLWSSPTYSYIGDGTEAARRAEHSLLLSPFDPHVFLNHTAVALARYTSADFDGAVIAGRKATAENPRYTAALRILAASLAAAERGDEARRVGQALVEREPSFRVEAFCRAHPYKDPLRRELLARHLRAAGLPD
jgi:TolB-like protein/tetratricopeptide (TPR) repeat protein